MATLMVENLQSSDTEEDVRKVFGKFGKLLEVRMEQTRAFVTFEDLDFAKDAVRGADGHNGTRADVPEVPYLPVFILQMHLKAGYFKPAFFCLMVMVPTAKPWIHPRGPMMASPTYLQRQSQAVAGPPPQGN
ncbi:hypothetical protein ACLB2K_021508 [Fragaria x ananassa]